MKAEPPTLISVSLFIVDCLHATAPTVGEGYPLIRTPNIGKGRFDFDEVFRVTQETYDVWTRRAIPQDGDLVLAREAPAGNVAIVKNGEKVCLGQRTVLIRPNPDRVDHDFLCYYLLAPRQQGFLLGGAKGATAPHVNMKDIRRLPLHELPTLEVQKRVGSSLSAYDDLIENNRRRMMLLEQAARLLYREWFVRLRFPGHDHTRLLNGTPVAWESRPLGRCAKFLSGGTPSKAISEYWDGDIPWVSSGELTRMRIHDASLHVTAEAVEAGSRLVPSNTILVVVRGMSLAKEFRMAMTSRPVAFNQDLKALVPLSGVDAVYLFYALETQRDQIRERATEAAHGTKKLDTQALASVPILVPSVRIQEHFREIVDPLNSQWDVLHRQTEKLRTARDLLLPRLMSGEIAV